MSSPPRAVYRPRDGGVGGGTGDSGRPLQSRPQPNPSGSPRPPKKSGPPWLDGLRRFVQRHGWRAYALPVLVVVTIAGLATLGSGNPAKQAAGPPSAGAPAPASNGAPEASNSVRVDPTNVDAEEIASDALPPGADYTSQGKGTYIVIPGTTPVVGSGPVRRFVVEVEDGITGIDPNAFADAVVKTLDDGRSWTGGPKNVAFQRVANPAQADFRVALTTPISVRPVCGYDLKVETSCFDDAHGPRRVYLNLARWVRGDTSFGQDLDTYHLYMVNHEVGHALGHNHIYTCLPNGQAPVMMQQTLTLKENQGAGPKICQPNAWPYPPGVDPGVAVSS